MLLILLPMLMLLLMVLLISQNAQPLKTESLVSLVFSKIAQQNLNIMLMFVAKIKNKKAFGCKIISLIDKLIFLPKCPLIFKS